MYVDDRFGWRVVQAKNRGVSRRCLTDHFPVFSTTLSSICRQRPTTQSCAPSDRPAPCWMLSWRTETTATSRPNTVDMSVCTCWLFCGASASCWNPTLMRSWNSLLEIMIRSWPIYHPSPPVAPCLTTWSKTMVCDPRQSNSALLLLFWFFNLVTYYLHVFLITNSNRIITKNIFYSFKPSIK